jgi:hypothetical protein
VKMRSGGAGRKKSEQLKLPLKDGTCDIKSKAGMAGTCADSVVCIVKTIKL